MHESGPDITPIETAWERRVRLSGELRTVLHALHEMSSQPLGAQSPSGPVDAEASARMTALNLEHDRIVREISELGPQVPRRPHWVPVYPDTTWRETVREPDPLHKLTDPHLQASPPIDLAAESASSDDQGLQNAA